MTDALSRLEELIAHQATWDEADCVAALLSVQPLDEAARADASQCAMQMIEAARARRHRRDKLDAFLDEFGLDSEEGIALMCLAEALLRIPDSDTADDLIQEKLLQGDWQRHLGHSESLFVNASTWGLLLTGKWCRLDDKVKRDSANWLRRLVERLGEPVVRQCMLQAMRIMGRQYILGADIASALKRAPRDYGDNVLCSFDALGEGARTMADADAHTKSYQNLISTLADGGKGDIHRRHGISIKLSALHPRYQFSQYQRVVAELLPRVLELCRQARGAQVALSIDAEEAERLDMTLAVFRKLALHADLRDWPGLGFVLQAYQKRAVTVADWLTTLAAERDAPLCVRLVKGAYWDREIKRGQQLGLADYAVFTRKANTDFSYLVCADKLLRAGKEKIFPQFASHNALTVAHVTEMARRAGHTIDDFELQRLHGMGDLLYDEIARQLQPTPRVRVYAPIGGHRDLLPYLVRRLLENGANSSFVNRFLDRKTSAAQLAQDVVTQVKTVAPRHPHIPSPSRLYSDRPNSAGLDLENPVVIRRLETQSNAWMTDAMPIIGGEPQARPGGETVALRNPAVATEIVGHVRNAEDSEIHRAIDIARAFQSEWNQRGAAERASVLGAVADQFEANKNQLIALICREAGRTLADAETEVREAVDFCHYYAAQAQQRFAADHSLQGPTGESNRLRLQGRGVFVCISPWNFPLAIFTGQIVAALAAGNSVIAKPAEQTPLTAYAATHLMLAAGVPGGALQLLPGDGARIGKILLSHPHIDGVAFTGSIATATLINRQLAARDGAIVPLIAETGGINAMLVDSTALLEHVVDDVLRSAFYSAGQRCSALRVLVVQEEIVEPLLTMLMGACDEIRLGDPTLAATDIGPIIDADAFDALNDYIAAAKSRWALRYSYSAAKTPREGFFIGPHIIEVPTVAAVEREVFGPVLHLVRFAADRLDKTIDEINALGYGLTLGIHSRLESRAEYLARSLNVGNVYVNRNMIGAVVGVQPFGGMGLSGTGPKAGGPHYLPRFASEQTISINTMATGGNAKLLNLDD